MMNFSIFSMMSNSLTYKCNYKACFRTTNFTFFLFIFLIDFYNCKLSDFMAT